MICVTTTRQIPTQSTDVPAGLRMRVISWGDDGSANLTCLTGWPRVSLAAADSFSFTTFEESSHGDPVQHAQIPAQYGVELALDIESASVAARGTGTPAITTPTGTQAIAAACQDATEIYPQPVLEARVGEDAYAYFDGVRRPEVIAAERLQRAAIDHPRRSGEEFITEARRHGGEGGGVDGLADAGLRAAVLGLGKISYAFHVEWRDSLYATAVACENGSLIEECERHFRRTAVIADRVTHGRWETCIVPQRQRDRVAVWSQFPWQGRIAFVTSFTSGGVRCCHYKDNKPTGKPDSLFIVTPADIQADRKARKAAAKATTQETVQ